MKPLAFVVFGESSRDDFEKIQALLEQFLGRGLSLQLYFVPVPEHCQKELDFSWWTRWAQLDGLSAVFFWLFVRLADIPWYGGGTIGTMPTFFLRPSQPHRSDFLPIEVENFLHALNLLSDAEVTGHLACHLLRTMPSGVDEPQPWLALQGGIEILPKIPFLFDYLQQIPGRLNEIPNDRWDLTRLKGELFEKDALIRRLQHNEKRYRKFFEDDITGDFLMDQSWRVIDCNRNFARIFGFPSVDYALGYDIRQLFASRTDRRAVTRHFLQLQSLDYYEIELIRPDGRPVNIIANLLGIRNDEGQVVQIRGFLFDNTPRKNLERQLRESQKMEGLGRLAGGIAHDFNNLLTVINGYTELLLSDLPPDQAATSELSEILEAGLKAADLTRQLLAFSRQQVLSPQLLDLNRVVGAMETMLQRLMTERIRLTIHPGEGDLFLKADKGQLEQVILNLVLNARDAMPQGGDLTITTSQISILSSIYDAQNFILPGTYTCLQVADTGVGMDEELQKKVFEPFFTTKAMGKGTGLGLAMVYGIVQQSGGYLSLQSEPGRGTRFSLYFEAMNPETAPEPHTERADPPRPMAHERILLVEDEALVREYATRALTRYGYQVKAFSDGIEALDYLRSQPTGWDVVLTDIIMPRMTGPELFQNLQILGIDIPFLYMSGYTDDEIIRHGVSSQQMKFIHKPFKSKDLLTKLRQILDAPQE